MEVYKVVSEKWFRENSHAQIRCPKCKRKFQVVVAAYLAINCQHCNEKLCVQFDTR